MIGDDVLKSYTDERRKKAAEKATKHGMCYSRLYRIYNNMKRRCLDCNNAAYKNYGGRGINICSEWLGKNGFINFSKWALESGYKEDVPRGECTLDRIDVNGNYCPENCRWIPMREQYFNRTDSHYITIDGVKKNIKQWSQLYCISISVINARINKFGWTEKDAVITPVRKMRKRTGNLTYKGKTKSMAEWSRELGINLSTIEARINSGRSIEEVLSKEKLRRRD